MKFLGIYFFLFLSSSQTFGKCEIHTYKRIVMASGFTTAHAQQAIRYSDCSEKILAKFRQTLASGTGSLNGHWFSREHKNKVIIKPSRVQIDRLDELITERVINRPRWVFTKSSILGGKGKAILVKVNETLHLESCDLCTKTGDKNIKVHISNPLNGTNKTQWIKGKILVKSKALIFKEHLGPSSGSLKFSQFKQKDILSTNPESYYSNKANIIFYKLNKPKKAGEGLEFKDLVPVHLVRAGKPVNVIYDGKGIKLSSTAMPIRGAKFGESIQLKNIQTKKIIIGKVIDFNKVVIEL